MSSFTLAVLCFLLCVEVGRVRAEDLPDFDKLWNYDDPPATEKAFRDLIEKAQTSGNVDYHAQLLTQIARTQGLQMKFEAAHATLDAVEKVLNDKTPAALTRYALERGRVFNSSKQPDKAKPLFINAWDLAVKNGQDLFACDAAHMVAIVDAKNAIEWSEKAMKLAESSKDERCKGWLGPLYNNLGWTYHDQGKFEEALELHRKGYEFRKSRKQVEETRIAKWSVARMLRSLGRIDEAMDMQKEVQEELKQAGKDDGYVHEEIGELLLVQKKADEARPYFKRAYELLSKDEWLVRNEPQRLKRMKELSGQ
jgi:tetratricopeptide (TPR) repeat protein